MKKLSTILIKSYIAIFIFQILSFILFIYLNIVDIKKETVNAIKVAKEFVEDELQEDDEDNEGEHFYDITVVESPEIEGLYIEIDSYLGSYKREDFPNYSFEIEEYNQLKAHDFFDYYTYQMEIVTYNKTLAKVTILKELKNEKKRLYRIIEIYLFCLILFAILEILILKSFLKLIFTQMSKIENISENININSFDINLNASDFFYEFNSLITSYKQMVKRLKEQIEEQIEFIQNASHELKTPIFIISGYLYLIKNNSENRAILNESTDLAIQETNNMKSLVEKLLFISNPINDSLSLETVDLNELICEIIEEFSILFPEQKIKYKFEKNLIFINDRDLLKQMFRNIISNAIKYGQNKDINLFSEVLNNKLIFTIEDYGIGISEEEINKIFEKFYMVNKDREQRLSSHGLGLNIVRKILEILDGDIKIISKINKGTTVILSIPLKEEE